MKLPEAQNTLGARRIPQAFQNNSFNNPHIQVDKNQAPGGFADTFSSFADNPTMQNIAGNVIKDQMAKHTQGYQSYMSFDIVRPYFHIDNKYITNKLKLIFVPFLQKGDWKSAGKEDYMGSNVEYDNYDSHLESIDPFGVDLYLPLMSLITFILVVGFYYGAMELFDPAILGYAVGKCCFIWLIETIFIKVIFAVQGVQNAPFMDLF
jgi:hypothetical protein